MSLEIVAPPAVPVVWSRFLVGAMFQDSEWRAGGRWTADLLKEKILAGAMQLWLIIEKKQVNDKEAEFIRAALVTDLRPYESGFKACHIVAVAGEEPRAWIKLRAELEAWAKENGCKAIETIGRIGWKRIIPDWKPTHIFLEKKL